MPRRVLLTALAAGALAAAGCRNLHRQGCCQDPCCPPARGGLLDDPIPPRGGRIPPPSVPTTPGPIDSLPPPVIPDGSRSFRIDPRTPPGPWDPTPTRSPSAFGPPASVPGLGAPEPSQKKVLVLPDTPPGGVPPELPLDRKPSASGFLEEPIRPPTAIDLPPRPGTAEPAPKPPAAMEPAPPKSPADRPGGYLEDPTTRAAVGLPGYARVPGHDGFASGRKPTLDGFDWLKANGFKTVVYLHGPSEDVGPARDLAEKRGLRFVPIAVAPSELKSAYDKFAAVVTDRSARPAYVADETGLRAGSLWYLVFRIQDLLNDDTARLRAAPLGLTDAGTEEQKQFWLAIQDVLAKR